MTWLAEPADVKDIVVISSVGTAVSLRSHDQHPGLGDCCKIRNGLLAVFNLSAMQCCSSVLVGCVLATILSSHE